MIQSIDIINYPFDKLVCNILLLVTKCKTITCIELCYQNLELRFRDTEIFDKAMCILRGVKDYLSGEVEINDKVRNMVKAMKQEARAMVMTYKTINTED
jgi:hypothetical protein